jgi:hypothetical protein
MPVFPAYIPPHLQILPGRDPQDLSHTMGVATSDPLSITLSRAKEECLSAHPTVSKNLEALQPSWRTQIPYWQHITREQNSLNHYDSFREVPYQSLLDDFENSSKFSAQSFRQHSRVTPREVNLAQSTISGEMSVYEVGQNEV